MLRRETDQERICRYITKLDDWLLNCQWKAYDPFDGLNTRNSKWLTFDKTYLQIALQQTVRRFPINLRPLLGITRETSSKGMGFCALGYLALYRATKNLEYLKKMEFCLNWLMANFCQGYSGYCWGNHFDYAARGGKIQKGVPSIVWTSLIANSFFEAYEALDNKEYFEVARSACDVILNDIGRYQDASDAICLMYTPTNKNNPSFAGCIHNANVLGGWQLAKLYSHTGESHLLDLAKKSIRYTVKYQLPEGGWYYGEHKKFRWIDNFHTGYVLESIYGFIKATGDVEFKDSLIKGYDYFLFNFFHDDGLPKYYNYKTYPVDIQCASQAIQTMVNLKEYSYESIGLAKRVALWTIENMMDPDGYFYFRKYPMVTNKTPMFHWGQATMLSALGLLFENLQ